MWWSEGRGGKSYQQILFAENEEGILERQWRRNIGEAVEQEEKLCNGAKTVRESTYLGDRMRTCGR